jgi:ZIP family zinc transporter
MIDAQSGMALLIAVIAGLSTLVGAAIVIISGKRNNFILTLALGLAAGVMLSVAFTDLLPEGEEYFTSWGGETMGVILSVVFAVAGLVIAVLADKIIPDGCHDGHNHHHDHFAEESDHCDGDVSRVGIMSMIAIGLHNFPEGVALYFAGSADIKLGIILAVAVILHNIPGGITIAAPIYYSTGSRMKAFLCTLVPSLIQPLAALLASLVLKNVMNDFVMGMMFALVSGILLFLALVELYPMARSYKYKKAGTIAMFVGLFLIPITHLMH